MLASLGPENNINILSTLEVLHHNTRGVSIRTPANTGYLNDSNVTLIIKKESSISGSIRNLTVCG